MSSFRITLNVTSIDIINDCVLITSMDPGVAVQIITLMVYHKYGSWCGCSNYHSGNARRRINKYERFDIILWFHKLFYSTLFLEFCPKFHANVYWFLSTRYNHIFIFMLGTHPLVVPGYFQKKLLSDGIPTPRFSAYMSGTNRMTPPDSPIICYVMCSGKGYLFWRVSPYIRVLIRGNGLTMVLLEKWPHMTFASLLSNPNPRTLATTSFQNIEGGIFYIKIAHVNKDYIKNRNNTRVLSNEIL